MRELPIRTKAIVSEIRKSGLFEITLPNGKRSLGHLSKALAASDPTIQPGDLVEAELTPFDFDSARIVASRPNT